MANRRGKNETVTDFIFLGSKITVIHLLLGRKVMINQDTVLKDRDITLPTKVHTVKAMVFPVVVYECESWAIKKAEHRRIHAFELWCLLEKTLKSPLDWKEVQAVNPKENQSWIFIGRTDVEGETPILWPPDAKKWLIWKDPDAEKDWRQKEKGTIEGEIVGWHHQLDGHEFEQAPGVGYGQGSLVWHAAVSGVAKSWTRLSDWTDWLTDHGAWSYSYIVVC